MSNTEKHDYPEAKLNKQTNKTLLHVSRLFSLVSVLAYLATFSISNTFVASSVTMINDSYSLKKV
jgi:hypothetical protein